MKNFQELIESLGASSKKTLVLAAAHDHHAMEAVIDAHDKGIIDYILVGDRTGILAIAKELGHSVAPERIVDSESDEESAFKAVELIRLNKGDFLMKGKLQTATLLSAVVNRETGIRTGKLMNHFTLLEIPAYHKLLSLSDAGMVISPDLEAKKNMILNCNEILGKLGCPRPKVAMLTAVETVNPKMPETVEGAELKEQCARGELGDCIVEGPISFDLAFSKESAQIKGFESPVTGEVDLVITPTMVAGNILCKSFLYMAGAKMAGCIIGAKAPIVLTSRGATSEEKFLSIVLCAAASR